jgi:hypothetical protein
MLFELNEKELTIIDEFLKRVQLTGAEVPAFNAVLAALTRPVNSQPEAGDAAPSTAD